MKELWQTGVYEVTSIKRDNNVTVRNLGHLSNCVSQDLPEMSKNLFGLVAYTNGTLRSCDVGHLTTYFFYLKILV